MPVSTEPEERPPGDAAQKRDGDSPDAVVTSGWSENAKVRRRPFPGPAGASEPLRIAMSRDAYADLISHAKQSLNAEVCGVLVGDLCEDADGQFVAVEGTIPGDSARKGRTHVTFTQETWTQIHKEKDEKFPKRQIVGWYHTHPGFGVEFSEMDMFVQKNFFPGAGQIAYVTDPLGGDEAILANVGGAAVAVSRFWVDGRERRCQVAPGSAASKQSPSAVPASVERAMASMDERIGQLMQMVDAQSASMYRFLLTLGMVIAVGAALFVTYSIYHSYATETRPPELQQFVPVPVQIGDKSVLLGVGIVNWEVPPSLNAAMVQLERERQAAAAKAASTQPATAPVKAPAAK
jgi:proteasome lid subunit RPN8/RPN11